MKGLLKYLSPFAPDQSGAVSVFYTMGGITVICDAGGCTGNICGFDEPRWFMEKSAVFSAGLRDMDAILGRDDRLVEKLKDAASRLGGNFAAIIGTPVPAVIATDFQAIKRMAEKRCGMPVMTVACTGTRLYDEGAKEAYLELFRTFAGEDVKPDPKTIGVIGAIPLDTTYLHADQFLKKQYEEQGYDRIWCYGMGAGLEEVKQAGAASLNIVLSPAGLAAARYLEKTFGTPYEVRFDLLSDQLKAGLRQLTGKKVLIVHQQAAANAMREEIRKAGNADVVCGTWFMQEEELSEPQDVRFEREDQFIEYIESEQFDAIVADQMFRRALKNYRGIFIEANHFAVSGIPDDSVPAAEEPDLLLTTNVVRVYGIVQGVGFRPFVSRIADRAGVTGSVANKGSYVEIFLNGSPEARKQFLYDLEHCAPERSSILKIDVSECARRPFDRFAIIESEKETGDIFVSPDIATCPKCRQELYDPSNRRYMHPFINCTACGPRLTILDSMPYDRERTSMGEFPMCPECEYEYTHAETRRYDAQPVCCNDCGPEVYLLGRKERGREAITFVRKAILEGKIIAVKGIGGFHLCCDAANEAAVARLRQLKHRPAKPFAVMMRNLETVEAECEVSEAEKEVLDGHQKPIILLKRKPGSRLAPSVAPDNPRVGVMLPYAPVQMLLFDYNDDIEMTTDSFVMTSGNVSGAPICRTDEDAVKELSSFCDLILSHNRRIRLRADDSVMGFYQDEPYMIRRSRGYAPLPVMMSEARTGQVLAVGGELKNTFCIGKNQLFYPSPYVGDMADPRTVNALRESIRRMEELLETKPELVVCDMHPKYNTTVVAKEQGIPLQMVQHHYAHILSCMAENDVPENEKIIGVSFDGTGYGTDQTIWGGEFLICDYNGFERAGSIRPFLQIGGDVSAREGWRIAVAMINELFADQAEEMVRKLDLCPPDMQKLYVRMAERKINCVDSTSAGRLFDAVSAVLGIRKCSTFESEASVTLQFRAEAFEEKARANGIDTGRLLDEFMNGRTENAICVVPASMEEPEMSEEGDRFLLRTGHLFALLAELKMKGEDSSKLAYLFHASLARQITAGCRAIAKQTGLHKTALSGGVFQNQLLLRLCETQLEKEGFRVYRHRLIPPNDGGLALGQAAWGMAYLNREKGGK